MAPDTVEMQAIKYAAMASRFTESVLADAYADFLRKHRGSVLTTDDALDQLASHTEFAMTEETLRAPRINLIAGGFPPSVTATAVWLSEMGLDITLTRIQAYRTPGGVVVTVSQHYPPPDVEWTDDDLRQLRDVVANTTVHTTMDLCAAEPEVWVPSEAVQTLTGREPAKHRGDYGGFAITLRSRFGRSNAPYQMKYGAGGGNQQYYRLSVDMAARWKAVGTVVDGSASTREL
jgi:hypothetical protein